MEQIKLLDCTLRDGGYYNSWDFDVMTVEKYLEAMSEISVDFVEIGLRGFPKEGFYGPYAFSTDNFLSLLNIPQNISLGVMVNASELINHEKGIIGALNELFTHSEHSPVSLVRIACHIHEFEEALVGATWLKDKGYTVGYNLMQIAERTLEEIANIASKTNDYPVDVLYFADSMGSLTPEETKTIIKTIRTRWKGPLGIHTHDNMNYAMINSMTAVENGVTWIDSTVTGMGRGPGNAKTEYLAIELESLRKLPINNTPLVKLINNFFRPLQVKCGWGTNTFYYLAGKYGIHPTYIQEMLNDSRYDEEDILAIINHLKTSGGKKFNINTLESSRNFYIGKPTGKWQPASEISNKEVIIIGSGPSGIKHRKALEEYIKSSNSYVIALNTQEHINHSLIDIRVACHPIRLLTDSNVHLGLPQPLVLPATMLPGDILKNYEGKNILDFGIAVQEETFEFNKTDCIVPSSLVLAYALAIAASGGAKRILLAGFDGYGADDPRTLEINNILNNFSDAKGAVSLISITPTQYNIKVNSIYSL